MREGTLEMLTRTGCAYTFATQPALDPAARTALLEFAVGLGDENGGHWIELRQDADIDRAIDLLRARGFSLRALAGKRTSLEEVFLKAIDGAPGNPQ